ncbi:MAG: VOC family protein, partial [Candidatus Saccharicenans sp.]
AFFRLKNITIELIEPVGGPSTWREFLEQHGEGVHHLAFEVKGMEAKVKALAAMGLPLLQKGDYEGGRYAYVDGTGCLAVILELLENF